MTIRVLAVIALATNLAHAGPGHGVTRIAIDYRFTSFQSFEEHAVIEHDGTGYHSGADTVDPLVVDRVYAALVHLAPADRELSCMSHTDDYPEVTLTIEGKRPLVITSSSNCRDHVPWNVGEHGARFAQFEGTLTPAISALLAEVGWRDRLAPAPIATGITGGSIVLGDLTDGTHAQAATCARAIETDAAISKLLGKVSVEELVLECDIANSSDCTRASARAALRWGRFDLRFELSCSHGHASLTPSSRAQLADIRRFLDSVPGQALVKLATARVQIWGEGGEMWRMASDDDPLLGGLMLENWVAKHVIYAHSTGAAAASAVVFWRALHVDVDTTTEKDDHAGYVTTGIFDFAGHSIPDPFREGED